MLLLTGCGTTINSVDALCSIPLPTVSEDDTTQTIIEVDNYSAKWRAACDK